MDISEGKKDQLVDASLHFMRALAIVYGSDRAMEFWTTLSDTVDPELKGLTFSAMLTGRRSGVIIVNSLPQIPNRVGIIKAIRAWDRRNFGLKEAKDMFVDLEQNGKPFTLEIYYDKVEEARKEFYDFGCRGVGI